MPDGFNGAGRKRDGIEVLIDVRTCELKLSEVMRMIEEYRQSNPDREVWLDGDTYAVVSKLREAVA